MSDPYTYQHSQHIGLMEHEARCLFRKQYNTGRDRVCFHPCLLPNIDLLIEIMKSICFIFWLYIGERELKVNVNQ